MAGLQRAAAQIYLAPTVVRHFVTPAATELFVRAAPKASATTASPAMAALLGIDLARPMRAACDKLAGMIPALADLSGRMQWLNQQANAKRGAYTVDRVEARRAAGPQGCR